MDGSAKFSAKLRSSCCYVRYSRIGRRAVRASDGSSSRIECKPRKPGWAASIRAVSSLSSKSLAQIHNGIAIYKAEIRRHIPEFVPFYPLGMPDITRPNLHAALGMRAPRRQFLAVWRRGGPAEVRVSGRFPGRGCFTLAILELSLPRTRMESASAFLRRTWPALLPPHLLDSEAALRLRWASSDMKAFN